MTIGCGERAVTVSSSFGPGRRLNYRSGQIDGWKCELWTGGSAYFAGGPVDVTIQLSGKNGDEQHKIRIRNLHVTLVSLNSEDIALENNLQGAEGKEIESNVWVFQYDDLFSAKLPMGQSTLQIDIILDDDRHWSTTVPTEVISSKRH
jgi:hypothetical protein